MDKTPEDEYREELKKRLTEKPPTDAPTFYSRTGFRKTTAPDHKVDMHYTNPPKRRFGLFMMLPILLIFMISGRYSGVVIPLIIGVVLYILIKRKR